MEVYMSPKNGALIVADPLYRKREEDLSFDSNIITVSYDVGPIAYLVEGPEGEYVAISAEWVYENLEKLGYL